MWWWKSGSRGLPRIGVMGCSFWIWRLSRGNLSTFPLLIIRVNLCNLWMILKDWIPGQACACPGWHGFLACWLCFRGTFHHFTFPPFHPFKFVLICVICGWFKKTGSRLPRYCHSWCSPGGEKRTWQKYSLTLLIKSERLLAIQFYP